MKEICTKCGMWKWKVGVVTDIIYAEDFSNLVHADSVMIAGIVYRSNGDPINILGRVINLEEHEVDAKAMIISDDGTVSDSAELMDDGLNGDGEAGDGIYGGFYDISEKNYNVGIKTIDQVTGFTRNGLNWGILSRFTGKGPVMYEGLEIVGNDTIVNPGDRLRFNILLKNYGITDTVYNVDVELVLADTTIEETTTGVPKFGDIAPGESLTSYSRPFAISFKKNGVDCQPGDYEIGVNIKSNEEIFWKDSFILKVVGSC